jgi:hypothetical protein
MTRSYDFVCVMLAMEPDTFNVMDSYANVHSAITAERAAMILLADDMPLFRVNDLIDAARSYVPKCLRDKQ